MKNAVSGIIDEMPDIWPTAIGTIDASSVRVDDDGGRGIERASPCLGFPDSPHIWSSRPAMIQKIIGATSKDVLTGENDVRIQIARTNVWFLRDSLSI
jgi:hypothetical protein